jgi:hypothetical protein
MGEVFGGGSCGLIIVVGPFSSSSFTFVLANSTVVSAEVEFYCCLHDINIFGN